MKVLGVSRRVLLEQLDRPALRPLPSTPYELATWKGCRANIDYHVQVAHNFYSVPVALAETLTRESQFCSPKIGRGVSEPSRRALRLVGRGGAHHGEVSEGLQDAVPGGPLG